MAKQAAKSDEINEPPPEQPGVVVGWTHHDHGASIDLRIQTTISQEALDHKRIDSHHFLMTYNQALLLAKFLLDTTGQRLPLRQRPSLWRRIYSRFNK